ncbi:ras association domain-containing protein 9 isoform 1-T2 [Mantella aurantiaca]
MEPGAGQIVVWVGPEEKCIYGLTKHTTSADVVQALLEERRTVIGKRHVQLDNSKEYCITVKSKGLQCTLSPTTKMLKLWKAWSAEHVNISFFLVKSELMQTSLVWNTVRYHRRTNYPYHSTASLIKSFPLHKQKNIVKKAFRKLAEKKKDMDLQERNSIKNLVRVIASQELTIKKQINRIQAIDEQIEEYKAYLHLDKEDADEYSAHCSHLKDDEFKQQGCKFLLDTESLGELLYIKDETNSPYMHTEMVSNEIKEETLPMILYQCDDLCVGQANLKENCKMCMLQNLRQAVDESLHLGLKLHSLFSCIQKEINYHDSVLLRQKKEYDMLEEELKLLNESNNLVTSESLQPYNISFSTASCEELRNITVALSILSMQSDTESDTGISSTYSQNSDSIP